MDLEMEFVSLKKTYMLLKEENNGIIVIRSQTQAKSTKEMEEFKKLIDDSQTLIDSLNKENEDLKKQIEDMKAGQSESEKKLNE